MALLSSETFQSGFVRDADGRVVTSEREAIATVKAGGLSAAAAAANTVVADTGDLPAGVYRVEVQGGCMATSAAGKGLVCEHRDAADAATLEVLGGSGTFPFNLEVDRLVVGANESVRVKLDAVALGASEKAVASIRCYRVA